MALTSEKCNKLAIPGLCIEVNAHKVIIQRHG